jgi:hypothetical protein
MIVSLLGLANDQIINLQLEQMPCMPQFDSLPIFPGPMNA